MFAGPIGTDKTHLAYALGVEAVQRRQGVTFVRATDLVRELLFNLLADRYERRSTIVTTNLAFSE